MRVKLSEFRAAKPGLLVMWGSAAWAQTQLTPGVSVLAAPRSRPACARAGARSRRKTRQGKLKKTDFVK